MCAGVQLTWSRWMWFCEIKTNSKINLSKSLIKYFEFYSPMSLWPEWYSSEPVQYSHSIFAKSHAISHVWRIALILSALQPVLTACWTHGPAASARKKSAKCSDQNHFPETSISKEFFGRKISRKFLLAGSISDASTTGLCAQQAVRSDLNYRHTWHSKKAVKML